MMRTYILKKILKNYNSEYNKLFTINISEKKSVILIHVKNVKECDIENLGASFYDFVSKASISKIFISNNIINEKNTSDFLSHILLMVLN